MLTTTYTLQGDKGTQLTVIVTAEYNNAMAADVTVQAVADSAPAHWADAIDQETDFVVCRCFDGHLQDGELWTVALQDDMLTHEDLAEDPEYSETFTATVVTGATEE